LGRLRRSEGAFDAARVHLQAAIRIWESLPGESRLRYAVSLAGYAQLLLDEGDAAAAARPVEEAVTILRRLLPSDSPDLAAVVLIRCVVLARTGKAAASEAELQQVIAALRKVLPDTHRHVAEARSALGEALLAQGKLAEAEVVLSDSDKALELVLGAERRRSIHRLIRLYELKQDRQAVETQRQRLAAFERKVRRV
jgi:eukaryotic-like serine/threonine-protein kinase